MTVRHCPLRVSTSLAILFFDWAIFAITLTHFKDWGYATMFGACSTALVVALLEQKNETSVGHVILRAVIAGAVVAAPLPLLGTLVALSFLIWSAVDHSQSQRAQ